MLSKFRFLNVVRTIVRPHDVKRLVFTIFRNSSDAITNSISGLGFYVKILKPNDILSRMKPNNICFTKDFSSTGFSNQKTNSTQNIGFQRDFKCLKKPFLFTILVR